MNTLKTFKSLKICDTDLIIVARLLGGRYVRVLVLYTNGYISPPLQSKQVYLNMQFSKHNIPIFIYSPFFAIMADTIYVTL